jgi:hypothetical protein
MKTAIITRKPESQQPHRGRVLALFMALALLGHGRSGAADEQVIIEDFDVFALEPAFFLVAEATPTRNDSFVAPIWRIKAIDEA